MAVPGDRHEQVGADEQKNRKDIGPESWLDETEGERHGCLWDAWAAALMEAGPVLRLALPNQIATGLS
jgi:hypothetical protein